MNNASYSVSARARTIAAGRIEPLEARQLLSAALPEFNETDLVSDGATPAQHTDANLVNPWGVAITKAGAIWVADNGSGVTTLYDQSGNPSPPVVTIPAASGAVPGTTSAPTGAAVNTAGKAFDLPNTTTPALYVFVSEDGTVSAWDPSIGNSAAIVADNSASGAVYKGATIAGKGKKARLYAANFSAGTVDVFDSTFKPVTPAAGVFSDASIPAGFAPFNVQNVGNKLYVTYAMQDATGKDDVPGAGNGFVDVFNTQGHMIHRLASNGPLNSPWGVAKLRGGIAVGNFGDGTINVFSPSGKSLGPLADATTHQPIVIDGLWALTPGVGTAKKTLFFSAGTNDEADGLFGTLTPQKPAKGNSGGNGSGGAGGTTSNGAIAGTSGVSSTSSVLGAGSIATDPLLGTVDMGSIDGAIGISNTSGPSSTSSIVSVGSAGTDPLLGTVGVGSAGTDPLLGNVGIDPIDSATGISGLAPIATPIIM